MLLFLHGFLGSKEDWDPLFSHLPTSFEKQAIDLPGHGTTPFHPDIVETVHEMAQKIGATSLVGYSAGGRIALALKEKYPESYGRIFILSANIQQEGEKRLVFDREWTRKLREEPFDVFLEAWYSQPLFADLQKHPAFPAMLERRKQGNPSNLARFLEIFSPARKKAPEISQETIFLFGNKDLKYAQLYRRLDPSLHVFEVLEANHAIHVENPACCAEIIMGALDDDAKASHSLGRSENLPRH